VIYFEQWLIAGAYAITLVMYVHSFRHAREQTKTRAAQLAGVTLGLHLVYLIHLTYATGHLPVTGVFVSLTTCAWLFGVVYLSLEWRLKEHSLGVFILPVILLLHIISNLFLELDRALPPLLAREVFFEIHVVVVLLAYSAFAISFIASLLYVLLSREIRERSAGLFYRRLPSLAFFDGLSNRAVNIGLIFLTVGVALGIYEGTKVASEFFRWDAKFIAVGLTWLIYVFHLLGRLVMGWQGKRVAILSMFGFAWLLFSFLIVSLLFSQVHQFR